MIVNLECFGIIYKITNKVNGKVYIGQTRNGFNKRYNADGEGIERVYNSNLKNKEKSQYYNFKLVKDIEKYGFENFEVIEVFDIAQSQEELDNKEMKWIKEFDCYKKGYNKTLGGEEGFLTNYKRKAIIKGDENICYIHNSIIKGMIKNRTDNQIKIFAAILNRAFLEYSKNQTKELIIKVPLNFFRGVIKSNNKIKEFTNDIESLKNPSYLFNEGKCINIIDKVEENDSEYVIYFNDESLEYITIKQQSNYTIIRLDILKELRGKYEIGLYIIYCMYRGLKQKSKNYSIEELQDFLNVPRGGQTRDTLRYVNNAKVKLISMGMKVDFEVKKRGKKITDVMFKF